MSDAVLGILKGFWLVLLYLFVLRIVFVVGKELRGTPLLDDTPVAPSASEPPPKRSAPAAGSTPSRWKLRVHEPESLRGTALGVDQEITIGRGGGCAISLPADTFVSTVHARVVPRGNDLWIEDLGSTNGTRVNGKPLTAPAKLKRGDRIEVGASVIEATR